MFSNHLLAIILISVISINKINAFSLSDSMDKSIDKIVEKLVDKIQRIGLFESKAGDSTTQKLVNKIKEAINLDRLQEKFDTKFGALPSKLKSILCDKVKTELRVFKYAAVVTAFSSVIGSISCAIICMIFIIKRCENTHEYHETRPSIKYETKTVENKYEDVKFMSTPSAVNDLESEKTEANMSN